MNITKENIVGKVVAQDYRTASVFKSHSIDFCCKGNRSIAEVCEKEQIDENKLIQELNQAAITSDADTTDFKSWDMDLLADYIEKKHHRYVDKKIPEIKAFLNKVAKVHGERHPELIEIEQLFTDSAHELLAHMEKEEKILFPYVREMAADSTLQQPHFGTVKNPIQMMMQEHDTEGERFRKIALLSNNYTPPFDACTTYKVAFALVKEFEEDLHLHIHLENNILFPKAIETEKKLNYA
ncbi:MAG: iron-sulfur cluster repair di-iron protein [Saprospiraceae bacterium]|nr:iron-sulfur cluster repair di-iron protein [Saprospiraceae bacterium]MCB9323183.1 iron-sulfur cluster repair di-iron protein [Lewinellaceae bacterium]